MFKTASPKKQDVKKNKKKGKPAKFYVCAKCSNEDVERPADDR